MPMRTRTLDATNLLYALHERLRTHAHLAHWLATVGKARPAEIAGTARQLCAYFGEAFPLLAEDEDLSVAPALVLAGAGDSLIERLETTARQHDLIRAEVATLIPLWVALCESPERLTDVRQALGRGAAALRVLFDHHLAIEASPSPLPLSLPRCVRGFSPR